MSEPQQIGEILDDLIEIVHCVGCGRKMVTNDPRGAAIGHACDVCIDAHAALHAPGKVLNAIQRRVVEIHLIGQKRGNYAATVRSAVNRLKDHKAGA